MVDPLENKSIIIIPSWYPIPEEIVSGIFVKEQASALRQAGLNISVFFVQESWLPRFSILSQQVEDQLPTFRLKASVLPKRIDLFRFWWFQKWEQLLQRYAAIHHCFPDLLHAHSFVGGAAARYLSRKFNIPYVITEHYDGFISGKIPPHWQMQLKDIYQDAAKVIAVSPLLAQALRGYRQDILVIPNLINTDLFYPSELTKKGTSQALISVGALEPRKNHELLLRTFARVRQRLPVKLYIIGDGPLIKEYRRLAKTLKVADVVFFTGNLPPSQVADYLRSAQLYISTSTSESFALAPVEALACGVPVIMLKCGSILENADLPAVRIIETEFELEDTIVQQLSLSVRKDALIASKKIRMKFSPDRITGKIREVYQGLLKD